MIGSLLLIGVLTLIGAAGAAARLARSAVARGRDLPASSIAALPASSIGWLVGTARAIGETLAAPLTGRPCVYYRVRVRRRGALIAEAARGVVFAFVDPSGVATIDPDRAACATAALRFMTTRDAPPDAAQRAFLAAHAADAAHETELVFEEAVVAVDATISVLGHGTRDDAGQLHLAGSQTFPIVLADDRDHVPAAIPGARVVSR